MPAPERPPSARPRPQPSSDAIERLYVYWLVSTVLLLLVAVILTVFARGAMRQQTVELHALSGRVAALEDTMNSTSAQPRPRNAQAGLGPATPPPAESRPTTRGARPPMPEVPQPRSPSSPTTAPAATGSPEASILATLDEVAGDKPAAPEDLFDPAGASALVDAALKNVGKTGWSGGTWVRLAVVARLLGRDAIAETFARQAPAAGDALVEYTEVSARAALARGRAREAQPLAIHLVELTNGSPTAELFLAATLLATEQPGTADEALELLGDAEALSTRDKLLLGNLLVQLEHWRRLADLLATIEDVPAELTTQYQFLQAISLARYLNKTAEALAVLDYLDARLSEAHRGPDEAAGSTTAPSARPMTSVWPAPGPTHYDVQLWRGITLMLARQPLAAREALERATELRPDQPEAQYQLGVLAQKLGEDERAKNHLLNALAQSARMAPAWQALGLLERSAKELDKAREHIAKAVEINPRRPSAQFALAVVQAESAQKEAAASALQAAFHLDPNYVAEASHVEALTRLFTPEELSQLAGEAPGEASPPETSRPANGG